VIKDSKAYKIYLSYATGAATPKKARKFKKPASPSKKQTLVLEDEPAKNAEKSVPAKEDVSSKKSSRKKSAGVVIKDTPGVSVSKKKAQTKVDRGKGMDLLSNVALLEVAQLKKVLKKRKQDTHMLHVSGLDDGVGSQPKVPDELQDKTTGINEGTGTIPGVPDVPKDQSKNENESWGESGDDDDCNDDDSDDDNDDDSDNDGGDNDSDDERTKSDEDENPNLNQNDDDIEEEYEDEYIHVNVKLKDVEHREEGKGDAEMTEDGHDDVTQETTYDQVEDDAHVTLTIAHVSQKIEVTLQSSSVSSDFATQFLNLDNVPPADNEIISMMNVDVRHEEPSNQTPSLLTIHDAQIV
ncbi:hypothetical protein Tco_1581731, partial [Tanacetum coccineum]